MDWWVQPEIKSKRKKGNNVKNQEATAGHGVIGEGLLDAVGTLGLGEDEEMDEEEGGISLKEEVLGFESPVLMSPAESVDGEEEEAEDK